MYYSLCDFLTQHSGSRASRVAILDGQREVTFGDLQNTSERFSGYLSSKGIRSGDRIAVFLPRSEALVAVLFAIWRLRAIAVIIFDELRTQQVGYIIHHTEARLLITVKRLSNTLSGADLQTVEVWKLDDSVLPEMGHSASRGPIGEDLALILYTSGSTGMPKGIMLSHSNIMSGAFIVSDYLNLTSDDVIISLLPFSFDYGLNQLISALYVGARLIIQHSFLPADICNAIKRYQVTGMACVPLLWQQLAGERSPFFKQKFPSLRYVTNTGGAMPVRITRLLRKVHQQTAVYLMYGLTEAFRSSFLSPSEVDVRPTSIGQATPNVEILVLNQEGKECAPGEVGELVHRGANIAHGYWRDAEATAERFRILREVEKKSGRREIAVFSGDFVYRDREGYLYYVGRKDQMIKSHGMRVSSDEIEMCLYSSGLVKHVVVFAVPVDDFDSEIIAAVVLNGSDESVEPKLTAFSGTQLPAYMRPKRYWMIDDMPQTASGKPDRMKVKEMYLEQLRSILSID